MASCWDASDWTRHLPVLVPQVAGTEVPCLLLLWVKHSRTTLPLWILITILQMPSPKMMPVSSPHTTATSTLMFQARQEAMVKPNHKSTPGWETTSFFSSWANKFNQKLLKQKNKSSPQWSVRWMSLYFRTFEANAVGCRLNLLIKHAYSAFNFLILHWRRMWKKWLELWE